jgi:hypothetical protein
VGVAEAEPLVARRLRAGEPSVRRPWVRAQALNVDRHLRALRPFEREEFGAGDVAPSEGHLRAVNELLEKLRGPLRQLTGLVGRTASEAEETPTTENLTRLLVVKSAAHRQVRATEKVWDFYFELFGQRQSRFAEWLLSCDRVALDCYRCVYVNLGAARSVPAPPPFSYMRTGFSPATYRRGIPLRALGAELNPFPLVQLPYHRLQNPWTLGAMLHEVSHNLQNELGLDRVIGLRIISALREAGITDSVVRSWIRWHRETFADMCGVLFGGEGFIGSLFDVLGRDPRLALAYSPRSVHPVPYLRAFLSTHLLRRLGFEDRAARYEQLWRRLYPDAGPAIPAELIDSFPTVLPLVVDAICFTRYPGLGDKALSAVIRFGPMNQAMIDEAAGRLAEGTDPGVIPERYLISAIRLAVDRRLAPAAKLMNAFYTELARR